MQYAKFWVALIGGVATSAIAVFGADTAAGKVATIVAAACTAAGVYLVPNAPAPKE